MVLEILTYLPEDNKLPRADVKNHWTWDKKKKKCKRLSLFKGYG